MVQDASGELDPGDSYPAAAPRLGVLLAVDAGGAAYLLTSDLMLLAQLDTGAWAAPAASPAERARMLPLKVPVWQAVSQYRSTAAVKLNA